MKAGAFFPDRQQATFFAMAADDLPLHFDMDKLTEKQKRDHFEQNQLLAILQASLLAISKPADYVGLFEQFSKPPWSAYMAKHHGMMSTLGMPMVPLDNLIYAPVDTYYETLAENLPDVPLVTFLMMSRSNQMIHQDQEAIERMLKLNSKFHFAENAPAFGLPVPETIIAQQPVGDDPAVADFFERHDNQVILKMTGQPGARNVKAVNSLAEVEEFLLDYDASDPVLVQQRLPLDQYEEWTADLYIDDTDVKLDNVRRILVADGLWIGNHIRYENPLTPAQEDVLLQVGHYVKQFGFGSDVGDNMGIDFFIGPEGEVIITEINPRWTAGLFPTQALRRVDRKGQDAVAFFELVAADQYDGFLDFVSQHMPGKSDAPFSIMHLGFSPFEIDMEGTPCIYCWLIVLGDYPAFREAALQQLGEGGLRNGAKVPL